MTDMDEVWTADEGMDPNPPMGPAVNTTEDEPEPEDGDEYEDQGFDEDADPDMAED